MNDCDFESNLVCKIAGNYNYTNTNNNTPNIMHRFIVKLKKEKPKREITNQIIYYTEIILCGGRIILQLD